MLKRSAVLLFALFVAESADAQFSLTTVPANPVTGVPFLISVSESVCSGIAGITIHGTFIDISWNPPLSCVESPPRTEQVSVPALPAGAYTIRVLSTFDNSVVTTAPLVVGADVPALDQRVLVMLAFTLITLATLRLRVQ